LMALSSALTTPLMFCATPFMVTAVCTLHTFTVVLLKGPSYEINLGFDINGIILGLTEAAGVCSVCFILDRVL
jgi:hypothetical protein